MGVPLIDLQWENLPLREEFLKSFERILESGQFILNEEVTAFEADCARFFELTDGFTCAVSSGTDALLLALMVLELPRGGEVVVPTFTFFATAGVVVRQGLIPRFADIEEDTFNIDPASVVQQLNSNTLAVIPVHLYGQIAAMEPLRAICDKHRIALIEDACQSMGARQGMAPVGSWGDFAAISFFPTKNLGAFGDAGLLLSRHAHYREKTMRMRVHGMKNRYEHWEVGGNFRMDSLQAAILRIKLRYLDKWQERRRENARLYRELLGDLGIEEIVLPVERDGNYHVYNQYVIRVKGNKRDILREYLTQRGIATMVYYPRPLHLQPCFAHLGYRRGDFPVAEQAAEEVLALPIHPALGEKEISEVVSAIRDFFG
ncbi:MAG: DegT/DnrJ/EryC1/StrS family aminotransferase [Leptospiraceae bacterium]|nr:DegT/DnrJ/EryC1/StrS family aminotransferase [Leptospiraceae bacterium]MDW8305555.1 DegT/DnrJ/EryC1/StrS family aminotransferase [Leptospiraceae bacterium]